ncbi:hypothetical protein BC833DRAFT_561641 [Globomyces pollinis-pini]|nr:hypothetical protein BC833DRAFT_561641 [Globomyces pollinis-pini]
MAQKLLEWTELIGQQTLIRLEQETLSGRLLHIDPSSFLTIIDSGSLVVILGHSIQHIEPNLYHEEQDVWEQSDITKRLLRPSSIPNDFNSIEDRLTSLLAFLDKQSIQYSVKDTVVCIESKAWLDPPYSLKSLSCPSKTLLESYQQLIEKWESK